VVLLLSIGNRKRAFCGWAVTATDSNLFIIYYHHKGEFAFSTNLQWLVKTSKRKFSVNYSAVSQFLCLRHLFGDETLFRGIRRVPQGELLRFFAAEGKLHFIPFFNYLSLQPDPRVTFEQVLVEGPDRFTAALERQLNGASKVVLPLSGGYDSRMIACGLHRLGVDLLTYTTHKDYGLTTDTVAAAAVAALLGATHHNIPLPTNYFARFHQRKCRLVQFETSYHPWIVNLLSSMPEEPFPCFDGLGGDACLGGSEITAQFWELWPKERYKQFEKIYFRWYKTGFESLVCPKYHREINVLARKKVVAEIDRIKGNPNGLIYLGLRNFTRRAISLSTFGILGHNRPVRTPFLDYAFFEWSLTIPVPLKIQDKVYSHLFQNYTKETSAIPTTHQPSDGSHYFQKSPQLWRKHPNRVYMAKMIKRLASFLPKFVAPDLTDRLKRERFTGSNGMRFLP